MTTIKVTDANQKTIKATVKKVSKQKGWYIERDHWLVQASKIAKQIDPQFELEASRNGFSPSTWYRFRSGEKINALAFKSFCQLLGLSWQEMAGIESTRPYSNSYGYISGCGFKKSPEKRSIFNDYSGDRIIDELWADPVAKRYSGISAYINANVLTENDSSYLGVNFVRQGWGVNLTIRSASDIPVNAVDYEKIIFGIRSPSGKDIGIRVRIVDGNYVCWGYGKEKYYEYIGMSTSLPTWHKIEIDLHADRWFYFDYDGCVKTPSQQKPNLEAIQLIALEVGMEDNPTQQRHLTKLADNKEECSIEITPITFQ